MMNVGLCDVEMNLRSIFTLHTAQDILDIKCKVGECCQIYVLLKKIDIFQL